jgi:2-polyprenyl-3-methyl-5-hydroxy-6-metoxy-1,4-benzoquinol methylase
MIRNEKCSICRVDNWHSLDYLRDHEYWYQKEKREEAEPIGFKICKECGFVTYDYIEPGRLKSFYQHERPVVNHNNVITGRRKNNYHIAFWNKSDEFNRIIREKDSRFLDVGCAQGELLKCLNMDYCIAKDRLYGTELNDCFIHFARNEYKFNVNDYYPEMQFDFISMYHTLEHFQCPDAALKEAIQHLKPKGIMYISVPYWFKTLQTFDGSLCIDFEELYHLNHVNVFSIQSFKNMLNNAGLDIIQDDEIIYGYTAMVKRGEIKPIIKDNYETIVKRLETEKQAISVVQKEPDKALALIPEYPDAYILQALGKDNMKDFSAQKVVLEKGIAVCPNESKLVSQLGKLYFQWDEQKPNRRTFVSNNIIKSEKYWRQLFESKPDNEDSYYFLSIIEGNYKKNYDTACEYLDFVVGINPSRWAECFNLKSYFRNEQGENASK